MMSLFQLDLEVCLYWHERTSRNKISKVDEIASTSVDPLAFETAETQGEEEIALGGEALREN